MSLAYDQFSDEEDLNNPDFRCEHGTFTGNGVGGDWLCGLCEDGTTAEEYAEILAAAEARAMYSRVAHQMVAGVPNGCPAGWVMTFMPVWLAVYRAAR